MEYLMIERWSPYIVGALIGLLNIGALLVSGKALGASTSFLKVSGYIIRAFNKKKVDDNEYYQKNRPEIDWGMMLLLGIVIGAFVSSLLSGDFKIQTLPPMWEGEISDSFGLRILAAFAGGVLLGIGSRWAGGCTSGHGISGTSQLSIISWVAAIAFFVGGIAAAFLIYGI